MAIHGQRSGDQVTPDWGIALSSAMGTGIVPRTATVSVPAQQSRRWPWSRTRTATETVAAAPRD